MLESPALALEALRRRDPEVVAELVRAHHRALRGYVAALSADLEAVDDLSQEVFLRALQRLDRVRDLEEFGLFLRGIARNVIREHARRRGRSFQRFHEVLDRACPEEPAKDPALGSALRRCMEKLPDRSRRLLELRYVDEKPSEEIGREVELPAGTVRVLLLRIREALQKCLRGAAEVSG